MPPAVNPNAALAAAVKASVKQQQLQASHERQVKRIQSRGRQQRATKKAAATRDIQVAQAKTAARIQERQAASAIKLQTSAQNRAARIQEAKAAQPSRTQRYASAAGSQVVTTATPSGDSNLVMVTIFVMAGLIVVYQLVTRGAAVGGFLGGLGNWLHTLSSNSPLFVAQQSQVK